MPCEDSCSPKTGEADAGKTVTDLMAATKYQSPIPWANEIVEENDVVQSSATGQSSASTTPRVSSNQSRDDNGGPITPHALVLPIAWNDEVDKGHTTRRLSTASQDTNPTDAFQALDINDADLHLPTHLEVAATTKDDLETSWADEAEEGCSRDRPTAAEQDVGDSLSQAATEESRTVCGQDTPRTLDEAFPTAEYDDWMHANRLSQPSVAGELPDTVDRPAAGGDSDHCHLVAAALLALSELSGSQPRDAQSTVMGREPTTGDDETTPPVDNAADETELSPKSRKKLKRKRNKKAKQARDKEKEAQAHAGQEKVSQKESVQGEELRQKQKPRKLYMVNKQIVLLRGLRQQLEQRRKDETSNFTKFEASATKFTKIASTLTLPSDESPDWHNPESCPYSPVDQLKYFKSVLVAIVEAVCMTLLVPLKHGMINAEVPVSTAGERIFAVMQA